MIKKIKHTLKCNDSFVFSLKCNANFIDNKIIYKENNENINCDIKNKIFTKETKDYIISINNNKKNIEYFDKELNKTVLLPLKMVNFKKSKYKLNIEYIIKETNQNYCYEIRWEDV